MAAPKKIKRLAGDDAPVKGSVNVPLDSQALLQRIEQLTQTLNEVITRFNAHTHVENTAGAYVQNASTAAPAAGQQVQGLEVAATNLFTPPLS